MPKLKSIYICSQCGARYPRWQGQCRECGAWNTISETVDAVESSPSAGSKAVVNAFKLSGFAGQSGTGVVSLNEISLEKRPRLPSGYAEFDRVLGGGIVQGSVVLIGGNPGAGKSTLLLQTICKLSRGIPAAGGPKSRPFGPAFGSGSHCR